MATRLGVSHPLTKIVVWVNYSAMATTTERTVGVVFEALADPTRRRIVQHLVDGPRRAGQLADTLGVSAPSMSRHLRVLLEAGVVTDERLAEDARARVFRLQPEPMADLQAWVDQIRAHWDEQLGAFKRHVERRTR
jgi:DNA-binding transcriptional ArsR family regulator